MSGIFSALNIADSDRSYVSTQGQEAVFEATQFLAAEHSMGLAAALMLFVEEETEAHKARYYLPGGGRLERTGPKGTPGSSKAYGQWDVAFPLENFTRGQQWDDVAMAYMSMQMFNRHLDTMFTQDKNTVRNELLTRMLDNTQRTVTDPDFGALTVEPVANGDAILYPPVVGSEDEATEDHFSEAGYISSAISATNDPIRTIKADLVHHFGESTGGTDIVCLINSAEERYVEAITGFTPVGDLNIGYGQDTDLAVGLPQVPGRMIGRHLGVWLSVWDWIPATYMVATDPNAPAPLKMRVDRAESGLNTGFSLIATDRSTPLESAFWRRRAGFGAGNRLNLVVIEVANGGAYSIPTGYAY